MARVAEWEKTRSTRLVQVRGVDPGYPFYGRVELRSKRSLADALQPGKAIVEQTLLDRLQLKIGDPLQATRNGQQP